MGKGYILYQSYHTDEKGNSIIELYGRDEDAKSFKITIDDFRPYFFIRKTDEEKAKKIYSNAMFETPDLKNFDREDVVKVSFKNPRTMDEIRKIFSDNEISTFESDVNIIQQYLIDRGILRTIEIRSPASEEKDDYVDRIYKNPSIKPAQGFEPKFKILSIDIETSLDANQLYSISLVTNDGKEDVIIVSSKKHDDATSVETEKEALLFFRSEIKRLDPDIIVGWNVIDFDFKVLQSKFKRYGIPFNLGREDNDCTLRVMGDFLKDSTADFKGRLLLDGIHLLKSNFIGLEDYKLGTAAKEILGDKKTIEGDDSPAQIEQAYLNDQKKLIEYNLHDSRLVLQILDKTNALGITLYRSYLTGLPMDKVKGSVASFDSLYLRELHKRGFVAYAKSFSSKDEKILGGFVKKPKPGIYDNILVLDFKSLYPSIMRTFNIDPLAFTEKKEEGVIVAPNGAMFRNDDGILPQILEDLWKQRDIAKKNDDMLTSYAVKILMNSLYGVLANSNCRFFNADLANAITHFGQYLIKMTTKNVENMGYPVIYGDTDSIFVQSKAENTDEADKIGKDIEKEVNTFFKEYIQREYKRENFLEIELEKIFKKIILPKARGSEEGSKKRYAGILDKDGEEKLVFTGLEFVRSDWTEVSKTFQLELLDRVFHNKPVEKYVKRFVEEIKEGKHDDDLIYRKALRKDVSEYTKTTPPHVKAAKLLDKIDSNIIRYYQTIDGPQPVQKLTSKIDYDHYIEKQIKPIADSILVFFDKSFDDVMAGDSQQGLGAFF